MKIQKNLLLSLLVLSGMLIVAGDESKASGGGSKVGYGDLAPAVAPAIDREVIFVEGLRKRCINSNVSQKQVFNNQDLFQEVGTLIRCAHAAKIAQEIVLNTQERFIDMYDLSDGRVVIQLPSNLLQVWNPNIPQGEPGRLVELTGHEGRVTSVSVLSNGRIALRSYYRRTVRVWNPDIAAGEPGYLIELARDVEIGASVTALSDGRCVLFSNSGIVRVWNLDIPAGEPGHVAEFTRHESTMTSVTALPDGRIVLGWNDGVIQVWNPNISAGEPGHLVEFTAHEGSIMPVATFDDGRIVSLGEWDQILRVWNLGIPVGQPGHLVEHPNHAGRVYSVKSLPGGRIVLLLDSDTVGIWSPGISAEEPGHVAYKGLPEPDAILDNIIVLSDERIVLGDLEGVVRLQPGDENYFMRKIKRTQAIEDYETDGRGVFYALFPDRMARVIDSINEQGDVEIAKRRLRLLLEEYCTLEGADKSLLDLKNETCWLKLKSFTNEADLQALRDKIAALVAALGNVNVKVFGVNKNLKDWGALLHLSSDTVPEIKAKKCANKKTMTIAAVASATALTVVASLVAV